MTSSTSAPQPPSPTPVQVDVQAVPTAPGTANASKTVSSYISPGEVVTVQVTLSASAPAGVPTLQIATVDPKKDDVPGRHLWFSLGLGVVVGVVIVLSASTTPSKT